MFRIYLFLVLFFFSLSVTSQQVSQKSANKVFVEIINAIGNNNPRAPKLVFKDSNKNPATFSPRKKTIYIENKVLEICYSFGSDSLNVLAYILAHELGHHYRDHGWMSQYASLDFSDALDDENKSPEQRKRYEIEADIFAGFYSHIAGYDALRLADSFLDSVYKSYSLPHDLKNYPTLSERKAIIEQNKSDFLELRDIFDLANINMSLGQYDYAQELYYFIINKGLGFTSREIFNNLGLSYVYQALSLNIEDSYFDYIIPFKIDLSTRLESKGKTRGAMTAKQQAITLLNDAKREFETAIQLDNNYSIAKVNLFYTNIALIYLGDNVNQLSIDELLNSNSCCEFCLSGHYAVVNKSFKKAKKLFKKGASDCDICKINTDFRKKQLPATKKHQNSIFDLEEVNGIDMYCIDFKSSHCDKYYKLNTSKVCVKSYPGIKVFMLKKRIKGKTSCVSIQEVNTNDDKFMNSVNILVNDNVEKILDNNESKNLRIVNSSDMKYISIIDKNLTFLVKNNKVKNWYYFERLD